MRTNPFQVIAENRLVSTNSVPADIEFKLSNYKPKILDANIKIWNSKKSQDLDSIFHDTSRYETSNINKNHPELNSIFHHTSRNEASDTNKVQIRISKSTDLNVITLKKTKQGKESVFL